MCQLAFILVGFFIINVRCELFTSLADMEQVFETESVLINNLNLYISVQENKLEFLRRFVSTFQQLDEDLLNSFFTFQESLRIPKRAR